MEIRAYQSGDEAVQVDIYNEAAADLPRFVPANVADVSRRVHEKGFDAETRLFALEQDRPVGYVAWQQNGRVGYPWCRDGREHVREGLFAAALQALSRHGIKSVFAAYRTDWKDVCRYFLEHQFKRAREVVNFAIELGDLRLPAGAGQRVMTPLRENDLGPIIQLTPGLLRARTLTELRRHFFENPYFGPESVFVCRGDQDPRQIAAVGIVVEKPPYADPRKIDPNMACFRLGAFGTEGMTHKRVNGMFSLLAPAGQDFDAVALDMLAHAVQLLRSANVSVIAAQVGSDQPHLLGFYQKIFNRQGGFPVFERAL